MYLGDTMPDKKTVVITMHDHSVYHEVFAEDLLAKLSSHAEIIHNDLGRGLTTEELSERAKNADAIISAWGTPKIDSSVTENSSKLRFIGHAAGSVKNIISNDLFDTDLTITNAGAAIARYVGEYALAASLALLRTFPRYSYSSKKEDWSSISSISNHTLIGKTVGIVSVGLTARFFLDYLKPYNCNVIAYDPYMSEEKAASLGVRLTSLEEVMSTSHVISIHTPITEETRGLVSAEYIKMIQDDAVFVNSSRGVIIDQDALTSELATGRFKAALDVTTPEPLPEDHPLRSMPNVLITPHIAGPTSDGKRDLFEAVLDDLLLFWEGKPVKHLVTKEMLATMA